MNAEKLTQKSIDAVRKAQNIAVMQSNQIIEPVHVLAGLLKQENGLVPQLLKKMNIEYKGKQNWAKGTTTSKYIPAIEYIKKESGVKSYLLKEKLIRDGIKQKQCEICGLTLWLGQDIPLELHHKDCNHYNNSLENLQMLCPNCHALQDGNSGANIGAYNK